MTQVIAFQFLELLVKSSSVDLIFPKSTYFDSKLKSGCWTMVKTKFCLHVLTSLPSFPGFGEQVYSFKLANVLKQIYSKKKVEWEFLWWFDDSTTLVSWCSSDPWPKGELYGGQLGARCGGHQHHWWARCRQTQPDRAFASGESPGAHLAPFSCLQCFDEA